MDRFWIGVVFGVFITIALTILVYMVYTRSHEDKKINKAAGICAGLSLIFAIIVFGIQHLDSTNAKIEQANQATQNTPVATATQASPSPRSTPIPKTKSVTMLERDVKSYQVKNKSSYKTYPDSQGEALTMSSIEYKNGFSLICNGTFETTRSNYALFNLQGNYSELRAQIGHVDDSTIANCTVNIYYNEDTTPFDTFDISPENLPLEKTFDVSNVNQLKIEVVYLGSGIYDLEIGFGDPTLV